MGLELRTKSQMQGLRARGYAKGKGEMNDRSNSRERVIYSFEFGKLII